MSDSHQSSPAPMPSNRKFGGTFTGIFAALFLYAVWKSSLWLGALSAVLALLFAAATLIAPERLTPLNHLWFKLGELLGKIVSPIVLGAIFFILITPIAVIGRLMGRDALRLKRRNAASYWIDRETDGPTGESFKNQF